MIFVQTLKKVFITYPYLIIALSILYFFSSFMFSQVHLNWIGDLYIYIEIAQNMFNDGILYKDAIDTKNMGFFFLFYYLIYLPYAVLFDTTQFLFIWLACFMTIWYFLLSLLIYRILYPIYGVWRSLCSVLIVHIFISYSPHSIFLNQPQIAIMFHLLLIYAVVKTCYRQNLWDYLLYGGILGLCFSMASPYAYLVLIVPALAFINFIQEKSFVKLVAQGLAAFCGFIIVLFPFFWYFYSNEALLDWWYWNYTFATGTYSSRSSTFGVERELGFFMKIFLGLASMLGRSIVIGSNHIDSVTSHMMIYATIAAWIIIGWQKSIKKMVFFSKMELLLLLTSSFCVVSRIGMIRWYSSYNTYLVPVIGLHFPMVINILSRYAPRLLKIYKVILVIGFIISIIYVPIRFVKAAPNIYTSEIVQMVELNPDKRPTVMLSQWTGFTYSTRWKHVYYNFYHFLDNSFQDKVYLLQPEILIINPLTFERQFGKDEQFMQFLLKYYTNPFIDEIVMTPWSNIIGSPNIFIRKDKLDSWILP